MKKILTSPQGASYVEIRTVIIAGLLMVVCAILYVCDFESHTKDHIFYVCTSSAFVVVVCGQIAQYLLAKHFKKTQLTLCIRTYLNPTSFSPADVGKLFRVIEIESDKILICEIIEESSCVKWFIQNGYKQWYDIRNISIAAYKEKAVFTVTSFEKNYPYTQIINSQYHFHEFP